MATSPPQMQRAAAGIELRQKMGGRQKQIQKNEMVRNRGDENKGREREEEVMKVMSKISRHIEHE